MHARSDRESFPISDTTLKEAHANLLNKLAKYKKYHYSDFLFIQDYKNLNKTRCVADREPLKASDISSVDDLCSIARN